MVTSPPTNGDSTQAITIAPVVSKRDRRDFVEIAYRLNRGDPHWVAPLRREVYELLDERKNPWFEHGRAQLFLARRGERVVGRISAHIDELELREPSEKGFGAGTGSWGFLEAEDAEATAKLFAAAEDWLRAQNMTRAVGPTMLSIWDGVGLLAEGFEETPTIMLGHNSRDHPRWVEAAGYRPTKKLLNYRVEAGLAADGTRTQYPDRFHRIVAHGERNVALNIRSVDIDRYDEEVSIILDIFEEAWSDNWGTVPLTASERAHTGKKMRPLIIFKDLCKIAELDGEPVGFMITLPDINPILQRLGGSLFPFGWIQLLHFLYVKKFRRVRIPLMGVAKHLHNSPIAFQLACMMVEYITRQGVVDYGIESGDFGWVLEDNQGMLAIPKILEARCNRTYLMYEKNL